jgi:hypothetical protein
MIEYLLLIYKKLNIISDLLNYLTDMFYTKVIVYIENTDTKKYEYRGKLTTECALDKIKNHCDIVHRIAIMSGKDVNDPHLYDGWIITPSKRTSLLHKTIDIVMRRNEHNKTCSIEAKQDQYIMDL